MYMYINIFGLPIPYHVHYHLQLQLPEPCTQLYHRRNKPSYSSKQNLKKHFYFNICKHLLTVLQLFHLSQICTVVLTDYVVKLY